MKLDRYVTVDHGGNYVMFHELNACIKIKEIINHIAKTETDKF